jgi:hypothetical protein
MKRLAILLSFLALSACDNSPKPLMHTRDDPNFTTEIVIVPDNKITETCNKLGVQYEANGCNAFYPVEKKCVIYVMPQRFMYDEQRLSIIGHELWHCRYGEWHD